MVLTQYCSDRSVRLAVRGPEERLEAIGQILQRQFPGEVLVTSDEDDSDELSPEQLEVLQDIADYYAALACWQPAPVY